MPRIAGRSVKLHPAGVMVVLPHYLHNYKAFGRVTILGEFLAVAAVSMCVTFVLVDMGRPDRVFNVFKYPTPGSVMFWDIIVLNGYLILNILIGWNVLECERHSIAPPKWVKFLSYVSIPWAVSIHTVTAFLYAGLPGRGYWLTAILAPRFLSSAFAAGPALLILLCLLVRKYSKFDPGKEQIQTLAKVVTYATLINVFFFFCEVFTVFYSQLPDHMAHFQYLFFGLDGKGQLVPLMWFSIVGMTLAALFLVNPKLRKNESTLAALCGLGLRAFRREWRRGRAAYDRGTLEASAYWARILAAGRGGREEPPLPELIERDYASWARSNEAVLRWARSLSAAGMRIAILSNMPRDLLERMRANLAWFADFPVGVFSCEVACVKPEERMFRICLESLGVEPQRTMFIDDSLANVRAARRLGISALHFRTVGRLLRQAGRLRSAEPAARVTAPVAESAP